MRHLEGGEAVREAQRIREIKSWSRRPWLQVKRFTDGYGWPQIGVVYAEDIDLPADPTANGPVRVFDANLGALTTDHAVELSNGVAPEAIGLRVIGEYPNVEAMINDGWMSD